ncbi:RAMP superfamily CRISPR-associated protein [Sorangium sp. So ce590]|uniref:RAMP superfamily CRISPR-associated protein n=1 Tax=Sorangium sp. So ce590 TaxID=3133317 RepID=UPI003F63388B
MIPLTLTATLRSPMHLGATNTAGNFLASLSYLPGRSLLGAVAWAWIDAGGDPGAPEFAHRFVSGAVSWGDLHPVPVKEETGAAVDGEPLVVPRTIKVCKLSGLRHGLVDVLLTTPPPEACPLCGVGLDRLEGVLVGDHDGRWLSPELHRQHRAHVSIAFDTGTARSGDLYSRDVLEEGQVFRGQIHCSDEPTAKAILDELPRLRLAVGGARSRGFGQIEVQVKRATASTLEVLREQSERVAQSPADVWYFTLTAVSPWCVRETDGSHARSLTPRRLARVLGVEEANARIVRGDARSESRSGWDGAAGLPTELRHVIVAGSTFLCAVRGLDGPTLQARLLRLSGRGIGEHRAEGLGRVAVNHPLHFISAEANRDE